MTSDDRLLPLVASIYDASLDDSRWEEVLARIVECAGGHSGGIVAGRPSGEIEIAHSVGVDEPFVRSYVENYEACDPSRSVRFGQIGRIYSTEDWMPLDDFRGSGFYQEWARPQGLQDGANMLLERSAETISQISIMKADGMVDDRMRHVLSTLAPHLKRATLISKTLLRQSVIEATTAEALDALRTALFLLDAKANITHVNSGGREMLAQNDILRSVHGQLVAVAPDVHRSLRQALASLALDDGAAAGEGVSVLLSATDGSLYVGHLLPLTTGRRHSLAVAYEASAALFVNKAALDTTLAPDIIQKVFKLTPTELRVLLSIVEIGGVPDVARTLDVAESTVKTHLNNIFAKTDTKRQADLVRLMAAFAPPVGR